MQREHPAWGRGVRVWVSPSMTTQEYDSLGGRDKLFALLLMQILAELKRMSADISDDLAETRRP